MNESYACNVAGAIFNCLHSNDYRRGEFICRYFEISRSTLYRKVKSFKNDFCNGSGRPPKDEIQETIRYLESECCILKSEKNNLMQTLKEERTQHKQTIRKLTFILIAIGISGRVITWILRLVFAIPANHTDILKKAQEYAEKSSVIMKMYFHQLGIITAIDEVFIEGLPVFIAVCPQSLLISNAGVYEKCTEAAIMGERLKKIICERLCDILLAHRKES